MDNYGEILIYQSDDGLTNIEVKVQDETVWLTQQQMADLFRTSRTNVVEHIKHIYDEGELDENSTCRKFRQVRKEGNREVAREMPFYNLDMIISLGYRVKSSIATNFRRWATERLKEYMIKGFTMDDNRLKELGGGGYFKELLERVRSIRASERRIWQQITDIFAECSIDYDKNSDVTQKFYATIQNKFHFAITGKTAAEIVYSSADHTKDNMGLTTWKNAPEGRILKQDAKVAKNYLSETEIRRLERAVTGYFDYIEDLIERENTFTMAEFASSVNEFLEFRKYDILKDNGKISRKQAESKASSEYDIFNRTQFIESDFDKQIQKLKSTK